MDGAPILSPDIARGKAFTAVAFRGHSKEMAERMKQPLGTVKTWVRSALKALREELTGVAIA